MSAYNIVTLSDTECIINDEDPPALCQNDEDFLDDRCGYEIYFDLKD
jgi:hypothetical protein